MEAAGGESADDQYNQYIAVSGLDEEDDGDKDSEGTLRDQDRFLPIANVARIMKKSVPRNGKIAKDAKECVQECVSEFISFITSEASERCQQEKRKTINGEDILFAMSTLGFDNYVDPLKVHLQRYREMSKGERGPGSSQETMEAGGIALESITTNPEQLMITSSSLPNANILATDPNTGTNVIYSASFANQIPHFS